MSPTDWWQVVLLVGTLALLVLAWQPAMHAWHGIISEETRAPRPGDAIGYLRSLTRDELGDMLDRVREHGGVARGMDLDGEPVLVLGAHEHLAAQIEPGTRRIRYSVITVHRLDVPGELICERDLFAEGRANVAQHAVVRNLLGLRDVVIGVRARVTRRVHADGRLDVAEGARLQGEASASEAISLARRARFTRLSAPVIEFGTRVPMNARPSGNLPEFIPPKAITGNNGRRFTVLGDLTVPAGHRVAADLVVGGRLIILENSVVSGSVRAEKSVRIAQGGQVEGAVVSPSDVRMANDCRVGGVVMAGTRLMIGGACVIGSRHAPTTLVAQRMRIATGTLVYGSVVARQTGQIVLPQELSL